jgi:hypothetical protein
MGGNRDADSNAVQVGWGTRQVHIDEVLTLNNDQSNISVVEKNMVCPGSTSQRTRNSQVDTTLPHTPANCHPMERDHQSNQQKSQVSAAENSVTAYGHGLQSVQPQVEPLPRGTIDIPVVNMPIPQKFQNIEDDEEGNEEDNEKDEDFEKFVADTERAKQDAVKGALRYARSMKKEKKLLQSKEEQLNRREALIGDMEREIERRSASLATKEDTLKRREDALKRNEIRISREEISLQERVRELDIKEAERRQLRAELEDFPARVKAATAGFVASPTEPPRDLDLKGFHFETVFEVIPQGCPDAGTFKEKIGVRIPINGKPFDKFQYLTPLSELVVDGELDGKQFSHHSRSYNHYTKDGSEKMVQKLIPEFLVQHQGNYYIHRLVLKEIKEEKVQNLRI